NLSKEDFLSKYKELKSISLSFSSLVLYTQKGLSLCNSSQKSQKLK
ncbi:7598_t:CDS:2, partial [Rhizophagus irregularis]